MARARNIKPGLFKNELLAERDPAVRLLFIGLWTLADREGRIEDRPKRIKLELFPYDQCNIDEMLEQLEADQFIDRYKVAGKSVILICNFLKHQTPHGTEKDSELPDKDGSLTVHERNQNGYVTGNKRSNNVKLTLEEREPTVIAPDNNTLNPESLILNPDLLIPDSWNHERGIMKEETKKERAKPSVIACPPDVDESVWADWLNLRKAKKAAVTETVISQARQEAQKAGMTFEDFLKEWCFRGSQGLKADWLNTANARPAYEPKSADSIYEKNMEAARRAKIRLFGESNEA